MRRQPFDHAMKKSLAILCVLLGALPSFSCKKQEGSSGGEGVKAGKFIILGTKTDNADTGQAKANAENAIQLHEDLAAMVGLYGYNPPACLAALKDAEARGSKVLGKVKVFGFDGLETTLEGVNAGQIEGTVVQQPFEFGYQSMNVLKAYHDGRQVNAKDGVIDIPVKIITKETAAAYQAEVKQMLAAAKSAPAGAPGGPMFAFISNNQSSFWEEARAGCYKAQAELGIAVDFQMPDKQDASEQNRIIESLLVKGECRGMAISVMSPDSQNEVLKKVADRMPLVTHDSDAPASSRRVYLGTNNYEAGRELGKFMRERMPDGGKIMIFVGSVDAMNASERQRGLIDALSAP
jgi:ribose transport system substrate-binding protein